MIRVLIVEDQAILRESLARSVGDQPDMTVVAAIADASEALDVVLRERPDMILMDVCTEHDSNGIVAAARIKEAMPGCRIIIMTGMPEITFVDQAREAGVDSFVYKKRRYRRAVRRDALHAGGLLHVSQAAREHFFGHGSPRRRRAIDFAPCLRGQEPPRDRGRAVYERGHH